MKSVIIRCKESNCDTLQILCPGSIVVFIFNEEIAAVCPEIEMTRFINALSVLFSRDGDRINDIDSMKGLDYVFSSESGSPVVFSPSTREAVFSLGSVEIYVSTYSLYRIYEALS